jgi:hypothetical protein
VTVFYTSLGYNNMYTAYDILSVQLGAMVQSGQSTQIMHTFAAGLGSSALSSSSVSIVRVSTGQADVIFLSLGTPTGAPTKQPDLVADLITSWVVAGIVLAAVSCCCLGCFCAYKTAFGGEEDKAEVWQSYIDRNEKVTGKRRNQAVDEAMPSIMAVVAEAAAASYDMYGGHSDEDEDDADHETGRSNNSISTANSTGAKDNSSITSLSKPKDNINLLRLQKNACFKQKKAAEAVATAAAAAAAAIHGRPITTTVVDCSRRWAMRCGVAPRWWHRAAATAVAPK